ncbi:outer membrane protein [Stigmatella erecta]|uniref:Uncharacterized protein n=1 Tax=Stigmatella erecta TaxID=83460 RepID=A0A1I0LBG6_9BACT|nr:porin family protein [Stigmatella erecta]SEU37490.1 hypothetical protein SAMN05443639_12425 [Stigmatella erecta]
MKAKILTGAVAALLYSGAALAGDGKDCPPGFEKKDTQASTMGSPTVMDESVAVIETEPVEESIGGSGQAGIAQSDSSLSTGSSMDVQQGEVLLRCEPVSGTGGSGSAWDSQSEPLREPQLTPPPAQQVAPPPPPPSSAAFTPTVDVDENDVARKEKKESGANMRGLTLMVGGGVEGYTGSLAPAIDPGAAYGVTAAIKPSKVFGLELGYSGAVNDVSDTAFSASSGPDIVRNGGQAAATFALSATPVQPYVLGGIGLSDYNFRGTGGGFSDDTVGNVPVGAGLRTHFGSFTADLRANYNFLFDQDFAAVDDGLNGNGRYSGTLNIGGTF